MNSIIQKYDYEIYQIQLSEFEKSFRILFNLEPFDEKKHKQNTCIFCNNKIGAKETCFITEEFYQTLVTHYTENNEFFRSGQVTFIKTKKAFQVDRNTIWFDKGIIDQDLKKLKRFADKLQSCLRFARYDSIECHFYFARILNEQNLIPLIDTKSFRLSNKVQPFVGQDTAMISALLNIDRKINGYTQFAIATFEESFRIQNLQIRFIHLMNCLEMCFNYANNDMPAQIVAKYSSLLISKNKQEFSSVYSELLNLFWLKKRILSGALINEQSFTDVEQLYDKTIFIEDLSRNVIKKLLYMNIKTKEELYNKLDQRRLPH
ncbi:MAG: hypothetical protein K2Q21_05025 [Chitinophagaceae bacterium]|nr:hypothetical protein [Chitinophagaceae bacterium]